MSLRVERVPLSGGSLATAYVENHDAVASFYLAGPPTSLSSYAAVAKRIRGGSPDSRWQALRALAAQAPPDLAQRLDAVVSGKGLIVATGQQAGLFLGPLYTLYKALTAVRLARQLEQQLAVPVMALFTAASEDHDWAEVNHTHLIDKDNRLVRLGLQRPELEEPGAPSPPVERIQLEDDIEAVLDQLAQLTPDTEFKAEILEPLREAYRPGRGFAQAFQQALAALLQEKHPILVVRSADPIVKAASRELLWAEWERRDESERRLAIRAKELEQAGHGPQVPIAPGTTNLFLDGALGRDRILVDGREARLRRSDERLTETALRRVLEVAPERVSPGALLRPVAEAASFPVVAYVGGPGEIAYLAESQVLFELHGIPAPVVVPRAAFRLVEPKVARVLEKYGIEADELSGEAAAVISQLIQERTPVDLQASVAELRRLVSDGLDKVEEVARRFDPGSGSAVGSGKQAVFQGIASLEAKLHSRVKEKHQVMRQQLEKAAVNLYPKSRAQERVLGPYPYLVRYGTSLLDEVNANLPTALD